MRNVCQCAPESPDPDAESGPKKPQDTSRYFSNLCVWHRSQGCFLGTNMWKECKISPKLTEDSLHVCIYCWVGDLYPGLLDIEPQQPEAGAAAGGSVRMWQSQRGRPSVSRVSESSFRESAMLGRTGRTATDQSESDIIYPLELISDR